MSTGLFPAELKTRISPALKQRLESEARRQQVKSSHLVREAVRRYLDKVAPVKKAR